MEMRVQGHTDLTLLQTLYHVDEVSTGRWEEGSTCRFSVNEVHCLHALTHHLARSIVEPDLVAL